jgi:hypothetical protein
VECGRFNSRCKTRHLEIGRLLPFLLIILLWQVEAPVVVEHTTAAVVALVGFAQAQTFLYRLGHHTQLQLGLALHRHLQQRQERKVVVRYSRQ